MMMILMMTRTGWARCLSVITMMTILMTLEPSKEPSLCLLTLSAVDVLLVNWLRHAFKEWCPLLLVDTTTVRLKKEELLQDLEQNPRLDLCLVHCHTSLTTGMTFVHRKEQAFKYICWVWVKRTWLMLLTPVCPLPEMSLLSWFQYPNTSVNPILLSITMFSGRWRLKITQPTYHCCSSSTIPRNPMLLAASILLSSEAPSLLLLSTPSWSSEFLWEDNILLILVPLGASMVIPTSMVPSVLNTLTDHDSTCMQNWLLTLWRAPPILWTGIVLPWCFLPTTITFLVLWVCQPSKWWCWWWWSWWWGWLFFHGCTNCVFKCRLCWCSSITIQLCSGQHHYDFSWLLVSLSLVLSPRIIPLLCFLLMMLPLHFLVVPLIKMLGLSSLGSLLPPMEPPARPSASCEHLLRKHQQPGALLSTWQRTRKQTNPLVPAVPLSLLETMFKTLVESIQW